MTKVIFSATVLVLALSFNAHAGGEGGGGMNPEVLPEQASMEVCPEGVEPVTPQGVIQCLPAETVENLEI